MARIGNAYLEISGDFSPLRRELAAFGKGQRGFTVDVKAELDKSSVAKTAAAKKALGGKEEFEVEADVDIGSFIKARAASALLTKESGKLGDIFNRSSLSIGQMTTALVFASPVILDVAGALGALTGSLGAATAGFGALAVGAGAAATVGFGGILAIAGPAIGSLTDLMAAQEAASKAQVTGAKSSGIASMASAQQIKSAQEQIATATRGVTAAEEQLQVAQESEKLAQVALTQARQDAVRTLQDMRRAAIEGETAEERAKISLRQAQENLNDIFLAGHVSALDFADAQLAVTEARQNLRDVTIDSNRAQADFNKAQKGGVDQMAGVVSAQQSLDNAVRGVEDAQQGVADAHRDVAKALANLTLQQKQANQATVAGGTSLAALALAQKKAGPAAVKFAENLRAMGREWRGLTREGKNDFFGMLNDGMDRLNRKLPLFARSANSSIDALRHGFNEFLDRATGPEFDHFIHVMTVTFAKSIGPVSKAFGNIALVLERIAVAVAPDLVRIARAFDDMTQGWVDSTKNAAALRETIHGLVKQTEAWWDLLVAAKDLIVAALVPGIGQGKRAVKGMTDQLREWTKWVNAHPEEIRNFFKEGLETTKELAKALLSFLPGLLQFAEAMRPLSRFFLKMLQGLNSIRIGNVTALTVLLGAFVTSRIVKSFAAFGESLKLLGSAGLVGRIKKVAAAMAGSTAAVAGTSAAAGAAAFPFAGMGGVPIKKAPSNAAGAFPFAGMGKSFQGTEAAAKWTTQLGKFAKVAGPVAAAITVVAGAFLALRDNFLGVRDVFTGFFDKVLKPLGDAFGELIDELSGGHSAEVFRAIGDALGFIATPVKFLITNLTKLTGLFAIGAIAAPFIIGITAMAAPIWLAIKAVTLLIKGFKGLIRFITGGDWGKLGQLLGAPFRFGWDIAKKMLGFIRDRVGDVVGFIKDHWRDLGSILAAPWRLIGGIVKRAVGFMVGKVGYVVGFVKDKWGDLGEILKAPFRAIGGFVSGVFDRIKKTIIGVVNGLISAFNKLPGPDIGLIGQETAPGRTTTNRRGIRRFTIGGPEHGGQLGGLVTEHGIVGFQGGGIVGRRGLKPGPRDKIPAMLEVGELVIPKKLVDETRKNAKQTAVALTGEIGKGYKKVSEDSKDFVKRHGKGMETLRKAAGEQTGKFRKTTVDDFDKTGKDATDRTKKMRADVTEGFSNMRSGSIDQTGKMRSGVGEDFRSMTGAVGDGLRRIAEMTNNALKALKVKKVNFHISEGRGGGQRRQTGGMIVPGTGVGDSVHAKLPVGSGIINRKAADVMLEPREIVFPPDVVRKMGGPKAIKAINKTFPRFQEGGVVDRTGVRHFQRGGALDFALGPYTIPPIQYDADHAGGNSHVHISGSPPSWVVAIGHKLQQMGWMVGEHPAFGGVTSPNHAHYGPTDHWHGGAIDANTMENETRAQVAAVARLLNSGKISAAVEKIKRLLVKGPDGPLKDIPQAILDKVRGGADRYLAKQSPTEMSGGNVQVGKGALSRTEMRQLLKANNLPEIMGWVAGAESLWDPSAHNASGASGLWQIMMPLHQGIVSGNVFDPNVNARAAATLYQQSGLVPWAESRYKGAIPGGWSTKVGVPFQKGGMVPYVGSFAQGGEVRRDGLAMVHKGEKVLPKPSEGLTMHQVLRGLKRALNDGGKALRQFLDKFHRRLERMDKSRLREFLRKLNDWGGPAAKKMAALVREELHDRPGRRVPVEQGGRPSPHRSPGGLMESPEVRLGQLRRQRQELREELHDALRSGDLSRKEMNHLVKAINAEIEQSKQLTAENRELRRDIHEHNELYRSVRAADKQALGAVVDLTASQIGAKGLQKTRNAGWAVDRRY